MFVQKYHFSFLGAISLHVLCLEYILPWAGHTTSAQQTYVVRGHHVGQDRAGLPYRKKAWIFVLEILGHGP